MTKLTDTQSILLASAAQRDSGSLLPLPASITAPAGGIAKSLASLVKRGLAEERETSDAALTHRSDGDLRFGLFITAAGKAAIGVEDGVEVDAPSPTPAAAAGADGGIAEQPAKPPRQTKAALVLALLGREEGATLAEMVEATGWLPHTTRAALTGLKKKGHRIEKSKRGEVTCYKVIAA